MADEMDDIDPNDMPDVEQPPAPAAAAPTRTATNPKTGQKIMLQGGRWVGVPAGPGAPKPPANAQEAKMGVYTATMPTSDATIDEELNSREPAAIPGRPDKPVRPNAIANAVEDGFDLPFGVHVRSPGIASMIRSPQERELYAASNQWVVDAAHAMSGARIGDEQRRALFAAYAPSAMDDDATMRFKAAQRQRVADGIAAAAGKSGQADPNAALRLMLQNAPDQEKLSAALHGMPGTPAASPGGPVAAAPAAVAPPTKAPPAAAGPVQIKGDADYMALPPGAHFIDPEGHLRTKPSG